MKGLRVTEPWAFENRGLNISSLVLSRCVVLWSPIPQRAIPSSSTVGMSHNASLTGLMPSKAPARTGPQVRKTPQQPRNVRCQSGVLSRWSTRTLTLTTAVSFQRYGNITMWSGTSIRTMTFSKPSPKLQDDATASHCQNRPSLTRPLKQAKHTALAPLNSVSAHARAHPWRVLPVGSSRERPRPCLRR